MPISRVDDDEIVRLLPDMDVRTGDRGQSNQGYVHDDADTEKKEQVDVKYVQPKSAPQFIAAIAGTIGALGMGMALAWTSPAQPQLQSNSSSIIVDDEQMSWIGSLYPLGGLFGGLVAGFLVQALGRKLTLILICVPAVLGWLLIIYADNVAMLYAGRILTGFSGGSTSLTAPVYIGEIAKADVRGLLGSGFQLMVTVGILVTDAIGDSVSWQWLSFISALLPVTCLIVMIFMPETPTYLVSTGKRAEAKRSLVWLRGDTPLVETELQEIEHAVRESQRKAATFSPKDILLSANLKPLCISLGLMVFQQMSGVNAAIFYTVSIFESAKSSLDDSTCAIIVAAVQVLATAAASVLVDVAGRRILLIISAVAMTISMAALGAFFFVQQLDENNGTDNASSIGWLPLVSLIAFIGFFSLGFGPLAWMMLGELFPGHVKGFASSIAATLNWTLAFMVTKIFTNLVTALTTAGTFWLFGGFCFLAIFFVVFFVPETKGKSLDEIQAMFAPNRNQQVYSFSQ